VVYRSVYFGTFGTTDAIKRYGEFIRTYEANGRQAPGLTIGRDILLVELCLRYVRYLKQDGGISTVDGALQISSLLSDAFPTLAATEFRPCHVRVLHKAMIDRENTRSTIKDRMGRIRTMLRWAVAEELIEPDVLQRIATVRLPGASSGVRTTERRQAAADAHVRAVLPHLTRVVHDMVCVQRFCDCRPGEVCRMSWSDIQTDSPGGMWFYCPSMHKTKNRGYCRTIALGQECQKILSKYRHRPSDQPIFSPRESENERLATVHANRATPMTPSPK